MTNKRIIRVLIVISTLFLGLLTYLMYFNMFQAESVATNPYNRRQWDDERYINRGNIFDADGLVLAETVEDENGNSVRKYSQGRLYSHVIGYCSQIYGKSLLERAYDGELLGKGDIDFFIGDKKQGFDLNLTISNKVQQYAYSQMKGKKGAVVAMDPKSGKILAMVSLPDFDPDSGALEENWNNIVEDQAFPLIPRTIQGLYPPGSTYKIVTLAAAYENGMAERIFEDTGKFDLGQQTVENYGGKSYGKISLEDAFRVSSNQVFCTIGSELGPDAVLEISQKFGVDKNFDFELDVSKSRIEYKKMTEGDSALVSIGQGQLLVTPMHMAMICSSVANGGVMPRPYLVESVTKGNTLIKSGRTKSVGSVMSSECAEYVGKQMVKVVESGTGTRAKIQGVTVAGKTGTAENEKDKDHSWFVGYAPAENPQIAVAVILENDGSSGGDTAAPIAGNIMKKYLEYKNR